MQNYRIGLAVLFRGAAELAVRHVTIWHKVCQSGHYYRESSMQIVSKVRAVYSTLCIDYLLMTYEYSIHMHAIRMLLRTVHFVPKTSENNLETVQSLGSGSRAIGGR